MSNPEPLRLSIFLYREGSWWKWTIYETIAHKNVWNAWRASGKELTRGEAVTAVNAKYDELQLEAVKRKEEVWRITQRFDQEAAQLAVGGDAGGGINESHTK